MDVAALTALAGNAVVTAAVTDAWEGVRHKIARLFGRGEPDPQIERRLDATHQALEGIAPTELEQAQADHARDWQARFSDLLAENPDAAGELDALIREISVNAPSAGNYSVVAGRDVIAKADRGGAAANVAYGPVTGGPTMPGPASS
jgi:hypothetical protein